MTAALERARYNRAYEARRPPRTYKLSSPWVDCPVCCVHTGRITHRYALSMRVELLDNASGPEDGARCKTHSRTLEQRQTETALALDLIATRLVGDDRRGWAAVDATAQGTE